MSGVDDVILSASDLKWCATQAHQNQPDPARKGKFLPDTVSGSGYVDLDRFAECARALREKYANNGNLTAALHQPDAYSKFPPQERTRYLFLNALSHSNAGGKLTADDIAILEKALQDRNEELLRAANPRQLTRNEIAGAIGDAIIQKNMLGTPLTEDQAKPIAFRSWRHDPALKALAEATAAEAQRAAEVSQRMYGADVDSAQEKAGTSFDLAENAKEALDTPSFSPEARLIFFQELKLAHSTHALNETQINSAVINFAKGMAGVSTPNEAGLRAWAQDTITAAKSIESNY